jgi:hypothetical protein
MLGFRTAILGRIYHKFRFADNPPSDLIWHCEHDGEITTVGGLTQSGRPIA